MSLVSLLFTHVVMAQVTDTTPPNTTIGSHTSTLLTGTASDDIAVDRVEISIKNTSDQFWNGATFSAQYSRVTTSLTNNREWSYTISPALPVGLYDLGAVAFDTSGNAESVFSTTSFAVVDTDYSPPTSTIESANELAIQGTSNGFYAIDRVEIAIRNDDNRYWNGASFSNSYQRLQTQKYANGNWYYYISPTLAPGNYHIGAVAFDIHENNQTSFTTYSFNVKSPDTDPPTTTITSIRSNIIYGNAIDNESVYQVDLAINDNINKKFWNGSEFTDSYQRVTARLIPSADGRWFYHMNPPLPSGKYSISARAIDSEGNVQSPISTATFNTLDGQGTASIVAGSNFVAGEVNDFKVRFTAGSHGVPVGGGISIGFHHASSYWVQTSAPADRHYFKVDYVQPDNFSVQLYNHAPIGMLLNDGRYNPDTMFHRVIVSRVTNTAIPPYGEVIFHFGANSKGITTPPFIDQDHQLRVTTDIDADGRYLGIASSPKFEIKHAPATQISAVIPSQAVPGETFKVHVRVEDKHQNLASGFNDTVSISDEQGQALANNVQIVNGLAITHVSLNTTGPHRLRLATTTANLSGRSNPVRVFSSAKPRGIYWADLHGHTGESDALGLDADEFFAFGRDVAALDIIALTDHSTPNWAANVDAVKNFYEPGKYVTILGLETASRFNQFDHVNTYLRGDSKTEAEVDGDHWAPNYQALQNQIFDLHNTEHNHAFSGPHHSAYDRGIRGDPNYPFGHWDDRVSRFFEVYSSHGTSEYEGNPRPLPSSSSDPNKYMQGGLALGKKFAVIGASDNHDSKPGRSAWGLYKGGLAGVWTSDLTRESVWQAVWNYSTYATSTDRIYVDFSINGEPMGSTIDTNNPVNIKAYIIGKTDVLDAVLIKDNLEIQTFNTNNGLIEINITDSVSADGHFYYLRVTQENGERAWSTPIWID